MWVCKTTVAEDEDEFTVLTRDDFGAHGTALLNLLPEEARMPMVKICLMYQEEMEDMDRAAVDYDFLDYEMSDDEEEEADGAGPEAKLLTTGGSESEEESDDDDDDDDEDDEDDIMDADHFLHFKQFFTQAEAAKLVGGFGEDGALCLAVEAAMESVSHDWESDEDDSEGEDFDESDDEDDLIDADDEEIAWKGA